MSTMVVRVSRCQAKRIERDFLRKSINPRDICPRKIDGICLLACDNESTDEFKRTAEFGSWEDGKVSKNSSVAQCRVKVADSRS